MSAVTTAADAEAAAVTAAPVEATVTTQQSNFVIHTRLFLADRSSLMTGAVVFSPHHSCAPASLVL